jgi:uncharacterized membrane protein YvbJ
VTSFEEAKRRRDEDPNRVRCAHCGEWIFARSERCLKCGTYFLGEAFQFTHESDEIEAERQRRRRRAVMIGAILALLLLVATTLYFVG